MFDSFKLKRSSWHMSMMNYIWGLEHYDFTHMCPYFWLSILNLLLIIPTSLIRWLIIKPIKFLAKHLGKFFTALENRLDAAEDRKIVRMINYLKEDKEAAIIKYSKLCKKDFNRLLKYTGYRNSYWGKLPIPGTDDYFEDSEVAHRLRLERQKFKDNEKQRFAFLKVKVTNSYKPKLRNPSLTNKETINKLNKIAKPIGTFLMYLVGLLLAAGVCWLLYKFYFWIIDIKITEDSLHIAKRILKFILIGATSIVFLIAFIYLIYHYVCTCAVKDFIKRVISFIAIPFIWLLKFIMWLFSGLVIIKNAIYTTYKNECPPIDWE